MGIIFRVIPKQNVPAQPGQSQWIAKAIDISAYREATLIVRSHNGTNVSGGGLTVNVMADAPTSEDATDFLQDLTASPPPLASSPAISGATGAAGTFSVTSLKPTTTGSVTNTTLPAFIRVQLAWGTSSGGQAVISADIVAKS